MVPSPNITPNLEQVPIFSLPEEWLWCEAWCGNASKPTAKTIDLCNNPLTKEPKLDLARRIGGERWAEIDSAMEQLLAVNASQPAGGKDEL